MNYISIKIYKNNDILFDNEKEINSLEIDDILDNLKLI